MVLSVDADVTPTDIDGNGSDDLVLADPREIAGSITGSVDGGDLKIAAQGTYALVVTDIAKIDPLVGEECDEVDLASLREQESVLGSLLSGDFALDVDQAAAEVGFELQNAPVGDDLTVR